MAPHSSTLAWKIPRMEEPGGLFAIPWTVAYQTPLSMRFSRQEYWGGVTFPSPGNLDPGIKSASLASPALTGGFFTTSATWEPKKIEISSTALFFSFQTHIRIAFKGPFSGEGDGRADRDGEYM